MAQDPSTPDLPAVPLDTLEQHRTGNALVSTFQSSGMDNSGEGAPVATRGNADARAVFEGTTHLTADQLSQQMDGMQARAEAAKLFSADGHQDTTAAIAHLSVEGDGRFKLVAGEIGDSKIFLVRVNEQGQVTSLDRGVPDAKGVPGVFGATHMGMNGVHEMGIELAKGERVFVLAASDGLADGYMARADKLGEVKNWQDMLKKDIESVLRVDPSGNALSTHLAASSVAYGVADNVTISSVALTHDTNLGGKSLTMAVFDGSGHTDGSFSNHLARDLQQSMQGQTPMVVARQEMAHISERPGALVSALHVNNAPPAPPSVMDRDTAHKVLRESGSWIIGAVDQEGGGYRPAVLLDTSHMNKPQQAQVREALHALGGNWDVRENYLSNPVTGSRSTIGLEGHVGPGGVTDIHLLVDGPLKGKTVEWSDDKRAWVNSQDNNKPYVSPGVVPPESADPDKRIVLKPDAAEAFRAKVAAAAATPPPKPDVPKASIADAEPVKAAKKTAATVAKVSATAGRAQGVADASVKLASGDVAGAAASAGTTAGMEAAQSHKAAEVAGKVATLAVEEAEKKGGKLAAALGAVKLVGKRIPGVGAIVTAGFGLAAVGSLLLDGQYKKAGVEAIASAAEAGGNIVGFGVGDGAREGVRGAAIAAGGKDYEVAKSGLRELGESAVELATGPDKTSTPKATYTPPPPSNAAPTRTFNAQAKLPEDMLQTPVSMAPTRRPVVTNGMING